MTAGSASLSVPSWGVVVGALALVFGTLQMAAQGNEAMAQIVIAPGSAADRHAAIECRPDEAAQEGVSTAECGLMVANVQIMLESRPAWFRRAQTVLALAGLLAAFASALAGLALVVGRRRAPAAALAAFVILLALDGVGFTAAAFTGPLLRAVYLWNAVLWSSIHLCLTAGMLAGRRLAVQAEPAEAVAA